MDKTPTDWLVRPSILAIANVLNVNRDGKPHGTEFEHFRRSLRLAPEQTHLLTWQQLLARAEVTFDPGVRPPLAHARWLRYLRPLEGR